MNFLSLFKAFDAAMAFADAAKRLKRATQGASEPPPPPSPLVHGAAPGAQIEARLTSIVVAALKEAFDRDHARLEMERAQLEAEHRRADALLQLERRRQAADWELSRLQWLAAASMVGWIASLTMFAAGLAGGSTPGRVALAAAWLLLFGALGASFAAQGRIGAAVDGDRELGTAVAGVALYLLVAGLATTAVSLLL